MRYTDTVAVIPARYNSERLPGKLALKIGDRSVLQHTYERISKMQLFAEVVIACDQEMWDAIDFDCNRILTSDAHTNGTSRIQEAIKQMPDCSYIVNIQGDEPFVSEKSVQSLVTTLRDADTDIASAYTPIYNIDFLHDYSIVKVVCDETNRALYFSRQAIPAQRDRPYREWLDYATYFRHIGMYGFRRDVLVALSPLERFPFASEKLEQLQWLYKGYTIRMTQVDEVTRGIDTLDDLEWARKHIKTV